MRRRGLVLGLATAGLLAATSCGGGSVSRPKIEMRSFGGVGRVLATDAGQALYVFAPDARHSVTCHDECAASWPPLFTPAGSSAAVGSGVRADLVAADTDGGKRVVTYRGWPLYRYLHDGPGQATGQAIDLNGGYWYGMRADGTPVVPAGQPALAGG